MKTFKVRDLTGPSLKTLRRKRGVTQTELAEQINCNMHTVSYWERKPGIIDTRHGVPRKMVQALGIKVVGQIAKPYWHRYLQMDALSEDRTAASERDTCDAEMAYGLLCDKKTEPGRSRCRQHGGLSTGPKTVAGKEAIAAAQRAKWAERRRQAAMCNSV